MKWEKFIKDTFLLDNWRTIDESIKRRIKDNFTSLTKEEVIKFNLPKNLQHHILLRIEYLKDNNCD